MIFGKTKLEMKVGIFVFIGLIILVTFILSIGGFKTWTSGYKVSFIFDFVNGVKLGAPVRFSGVTGFSSSRTGRFRLADRAAVRSFRRSTENPTS